MDLVQAHKTMQERGLSGGTHQDLEGEAAAKENSPSPFFSSCCQRGFPFHQLLFAPHFCETPNGKGEAVLH